MEQKPIAVVMCDFQCLPQGLTGQSGFTDQDDVTVIEKICTAKKLKKLAQLKGKKVIFGGCPLVNSNGYWESIIKALNLENHEYRILDIKSEILDRYDDKKSIISNLHHRLASIRSILSRTTPLIDNIVSPDRKVLVFGSGLSAFATALKLADEDIAVDIEDAPEEPLSPGCLAEMVRKPDIISSLKRRAIESPNISLIAAESPKEVKVKEEGFSIVTEKGLTLDYGTIVFAPERYEQENEETGTYNLSQLYTITTSGTGWTGETVFFLDYKFETPPEIFEDVLYIASYIREFLNLEVRILMRNARISLPGLEEFYDRCRDQGVVFIKYENDVLKANRYGDFTLTFTDTQMRTEEVITNPSNLVIPGRTCISTRARDFAGKLKLRVFGEDLFQPDSLWRFSNQSNRAGIYVVGPSRRVMDARTIYDDAAALAFNLRQRLSPEGISIEEQIPVIDKDKCAYCLTCIRVCPFGAMEKNIEERIASLIRPACKSCGICAAECPAGAITIRNMDDEAVTEGIRALA